jgi:transposase InsO family protein
MPNRPPSPRLPMPRQWSRGVQSALLHVIALAQNAILYTRSWAGANRSQRVRLAAKANQLAQEMALLREEIRIKDARLARIPPSQRPHYRPCERLAILELRAARGWSLAQTANVFQVTAATIASWNHRLDDDGPSALLRTQKPVNTFPGFVRYVVQRLQTLCPLLGKAKFAQVLARAGLHLGVTTVGRMRRHQPATPPPRMPCPEPMPAARRITAKRPNHVWHVDLTVVPTGAGCWTSWLPFALPPCWPFCWWVAIVLDHYSRRVMGLTVFKQQPTSETVRQFLGRVIAVAGTAPKHLVTDSGTQFTCAAFGPWCRRHGIRHRKGAVGQTGSIAVVERLIRTMKDGCTRVLPVVPLLRHAFLHELQLFVAWYNVHRPHTTPKGATQHEVHFGTRPACSHPRFEPRPGWPRASLCARPQTLVKGQPGVRLQLTVEFVDDRRHLPRVTFRRAA